MVRDVHEKRKVLQLEHLESGQDLPATFWAVFADYADHCFNKFESKWPNDFGALAGPMKELIAYHKLVLIPGWNDSESKIRAQMKSLIQRYITRLIERHTAARNTNGWGTAGHRMTSSRPDSDLYPHDWSMIWGALGLLGPNQYFCEKMGREKIIFERLA